MVGSWKRSKFTMYVSARWSFFIVPQWKNLKFDLDLSYEILAVWVISRTLEQLLELFMTFKPQK